MTRALETGQVTYLGSLNAALHDILGADPRAVVLGEDILDPYGGAFKVTKGLSSAFPSRVLATPISEAGIVGVAVGLGLRGMHPIVEIMFGDFLGLAFDQILNHLTKYPLMYANQREMHVVIRAPVGGGRGYGPTHSQSLEKYFAGIPGLTVLAPSDLHDPGATLRAAVAAGTPVLFLEGKLLYARSLVESSGLAAREWTVTTYRNSGGLGTTVRLTNARGGKADATLVTYGSAAVLAEQAAYSTLLEDETTTELFVMENLSDLNMDAVIDSARSSGRLLTVEEGTGRYGIGAEIVARIAEAGFKGRAGRVAAGDTIIPTAKHLEAGVLPSAASIADSIRTLCA